MSYVRFAIMIFIIMLSACGQGDNPSSQEVEEHEVSAMSQKSSSFLSFSWIEHGFNGVFEPLDLHLGVSSDVIRTQFGEPKQMGHYEGGKYWNYGNASIFLNAEEDTSVAVAYNIAEYQLREDDLKKALGTPDQTEVDERDGFTVYHYYLDEYELFFEADPDTGKIVYVWFHELKQDRLATL
ncbi:DUF4309 domain-containing protein [Halalkalibacter urbisdiaboli]|uniref:DUF4309 domain-containing protein n=1 Tax=Halalkalibacter urbisdiaboli TaxID=1960589 RepID=UPI000B44C0BA|nr:DUF4309 domain-containing protein [Halalkalibacter urbisdiaboli]